MTEKIATEQIEESISALLDAVGETSLSKAYGGTAVDQGGHDDERGKTSGGYPGGGDVGGLDNMMIGKMGTALADAGFNSDQIVAFMSSFGKDDEDDAPKMKGKMKEEDEDDDEDEETEKSLDADDWNLAKSFEEEVEIADAINVSPFLEGLVDRTTSTLSTMHKSMAESRTKQEAINKSMAVAIADISQMVQKIGQRLDVVEATPVAPRGVRNLPRGMAKSHAASGGAQLRKSEVLGTLSYMNLEKSISEIGGFATSELIGLYEAGGELHPAAYQAVNRFLAAHPSEAETAKRYR